MGWVSLTYIFVGFVFLACGVFWGYQSYRWKKIWQMWNPDDADR